MMDIRMRMRALLIMLGGPDKLHRHVPQSQALSIPLLGRRVQAQATMDIAW